MMLLAKDLSLKRVSSIGAIDNYLLSSAPANLDFNDFIISSSWYGFLDNHPVFPMTSVELEYLGSQEKTLLSL